MSGAIRPAGRRWTVSSFDAVVERYAKEPVTFTETDALKTCHWSLGEESRLREDARFRPTPWGRWLLSERLLANDALYEVMREQGRPQVNLTAGLKELGNPGGRAWAFCTADPRFVLDGDVLRLAAAELTDRPLYEDATELEKYATHLPVHTLEAVAASAPAGEWGPRGQEKAIETLGWIRVQVPGHRLNKKMFVAEVRGESMENLKRHFNGLAVFELWPEGSRRDRVVLVRGAGVDKDLGRYALKKYVGEARNAERERERLTLESLSSDKTRYPDIVLERAQESDLEVVAWLVAPLTPADYNRSPKPGTPRGRRDLTSRGGLARVEEGLRQAARRFFEGRSLEPPAEDDGTESHDLEWTSRFLCLEAAASGLHLEAGPLPLPPMVKRLVVASGGRAWPTLASNFRSKAWRVAVSPSAQSYAWTSPGFEDLLEKELGQLTVGGLPENVPSLFRVDALGIGRMLSTRQVSSGQTYRVLVPPGLGSNLPGDGSVAELEAGWQLWETTLPARMDDDICVVLGSLGLEVGSTTPKLEWVIVPPVSYETNPAGEPYPCFPVGSEPVLMARGYAALRDGDARLFLAGSMGMESVPLPRGDDASIRLEGLDPGRYVAQLLHARTRIDPVRLPFAVVEGDEAPVSAKLEVRLDGMGRPVDASGRLGLAAEFSVVEGPQPAFEVDGPPFWPVGPAWITERRKPLERTSLDANGVLDPEELFRALAPYVHGATVADLVLSFLELGTVTVALSRETEAGALFSRVREFVASRLETAQGMRGQNSLLRAHWLDPLLKTLGYRIQEVDPVHLEVSPAGATALLLKVLERRAGRIVPEPRRLLVLVDPESSLSPLSDSVRNFADDLSRRFGLQNSIVTDGIRWLSHRRGQRIHRSAPEDLGAGIQAESDEALKDFLSDFAPEVDS